MNVICEGAEEQALSKFIAAIIPSKVTFGGGNNQVTDYVKPGELNVIYLDFIEDNKNTVEAFNQAVRKSTVSTPILPIPMVCAEYHYIKVCEAAGVAGDSEVVKDVLRKNYSFNRKGLRCLKGPVTNFERLCKLAYESKVGPCARQVLSGRLEIGEPKLMVCACPCGDSSHEVDFDFESKAKEFLREIRFVPGHTFGKPIRIYEVACEVQKIIEGYNRKAVSMGKKTIELLKLEHYIGLEE